MTPAQLAALPSELRILGAIESGDVYLNGEWLNPDLSGQLLNASGYTEGEGFKWGGYYPGAAQLSLAILLEYMPVGAATDLYQDFKFRVINELPQTNFDVTLCLRQEIEEIIKLKIIK